MGRLSKSFCCFAVILCVSSAAEAVGRNDLVVMLGYRAASDPYNVEVGAGILVHQDGERAIVVTARHNLPERDPASPKFRDETVYVELFSVGDRDFPAQVLAEAADPDLDLAVLEIRGVSVSPQLFEAARHVLVPEGAEVVVAHGAFAVGNPNRRPWFQNYAPEPILEKLVQDDREVLRFESSVADVGMSGGALFSEHGALLGMVWKISGGEGGPQALGIGTIARKLEEWKIPFSLEENPEVIRSASRRILADMGLASAAGLRQSLEEDTPDFGLLHLFWLAGLEPLEIETAMGGLVEGSQIAFTSQVFKRLGKTESCLLPTAGSSRLSAAQLDLVRAGLEGLVSDRLLDIEKFQTCSAHLQLWIRGLVAGGLDPDLVVANHYYRREALLAVAMGATNVPAMLALLRSGASPHPYQDLSGTEYPSTRLLAPLQYVLRDFVGAEQGALREAFLSSGLVVSHSISNSYHNHHLASEALSGLPTTPGLSEAETDPICERAGKRYYFDWCGYLRGLAATIRFKTGTQECDPSGYCFANLTHTLFVGEERALLLAERQAFDDPPMPVVVEVTRESGQWYAWEHGNSYGCIPRDDGFESSICWRRYSAWPASFQATEEKAEAERSRATSKPSLLDSLEMEGISLSTPLPEALATLEAAGYTTETVAGPGSDRNVLTTRDYTRGLGDTARQLKVIAMNDGIRALSCRVYGEEDPETGFEPPAADDADFLSYETNEWKDGGEILAVAASGIGKSFLRYQKWTTRYVPVEIDLLWRAEDETAPEQAFYERWLGEWLEQIKVPASSQGPCIDRHAHLRGPKGNGCQTPGERAASYLEKVRTGANIRQLASGLSYEVLVEGQGPSPSADSSIVAYLVFKYLDGARRDDRINSWQMVVREIQWPDVKEAVLAMQEGDKWRIYVPPGVGSNDSYYLQLAEIELTRVGGD